VATSVRLVPVSAAGRRQVIPSTGALAVSDIAHIGVVLSGPAATAATVSITEVNLTPKRVTLDPKPVARNP
jgi:hypothetical protein